MTRINIGIDPAELCDQHLIAEYRELPRAFRPHAGPIPAEFCLGKGHVTYCSAYQATITRRQCALIEEMQRRGFKTGHVAPLIAGRVMPGFEIARARQLVRKRILERLSTMKRQPTWTTRNVPRWVTTNAKRPANR